METDVAPMLTHSDVDTARSVPTGHNAMDKKDDEDCARCSVR